MSDDNRTPDLPEGMTRRQFIGATAVAGAAAAMHGPAHALARANEVRAPRPAVPPTVELSIDDVRDGLAAGRFTSRSLTEQYLERIAATDRTGPSLHAVLETNPDALDVADSLDAERRAKGPRGPLHGVPILVKDNLATADRMLTTAGSLALVGARVPRDAFVVQRLRAAGAIVLGKTNLSEWANFRSTHSSSGWTGRGGQCRNPYALDRSPSGSSSGTGAAVAANFCTVGIGTETDGSILSPSSACSLVGIKPTVGLVSRAGIIPISHNQDTAGPMARSVRDAAILLGAIAGADTRDVATASNAGHVEADYTRFLDARGLAGARIGVARKVYMGYSVAADALVEAAIALMKDAGAVIVDPADIETAGSWDDSEFDALLYDFKADLNAYLADLGPSSPAKSMADLIAFNEQHRAQELEYFGQEIFTMAEKKGPLTEDAYVKAVEKNHTATRANGIDATMDKYRLDAIIAPTAGPAPLIDLVNGDPGGGGSSTSPAAVAGYPSITVPCGYHFGVPVGLSFFGRAYSEGALLRIAYAYEQASHMRVAPQFLSTASLG